MGMNRPLWLLKPIEEYEYLPLQEIAHNLSAINRFAGALRWSVLQHSLLVGELCVVKPSAWALLHDAHEAWDGDTTKLAKDALGIAWENFEAARREQMCKLAGIIVCQDELAWVNAADTLAAEIEMQMNRDGGLCDPADGVNERLRRSIRDLRTLEVNDLVSTWIANTLDALHEVQQ
jgi:hypothetical protein